jgi:signal peptidase
VATAALCVVALFVVADGLALAFGGFALHTVLSGSMRPGIQPGDLVVVQRAPASSLHVGDVIAFLPPDGGTAPVAPGSSEPVLHRVISMDQSTGILQTRGDANTAADSPVVLRGEAWRLVARIPLAGWLWAFRGVLWIVAGAFLLLVALRYVWEEVMPLILRR